MAFDDFEDSFNSRARDSFNTSTTNNANLNVGLDNVGNTDNSQVDSGNAVFDVDNSATFDSHDVVTETETRIEDSYNTYEDNSVVDASDTWVRDSYNQWTDASTNDSNNSFSWTSTDDHSIQVGNRDYNTGFGNINVGGGAGGAGGAGGGDVFLDGRATIVDQSVNQNIDAFAVDQASASNAIVASGDGAIAAGDNVSIRQSLDDSTTIIGGGDVNMGNTTTVDMVVDSYNVEEDFSQTTDASQEWEIRDSFNDYSDNYEATNSFNDEIAISSENDWDIDANVIWDSSAAIIVDGSDVDLPPA